MHGFLRRYPAPLAFLGLFGAMWLVQVCVLPPGDRHAVIAWASTNLANLAVNPVGSMVASAFVAEGSQGVLLVLAAVGLFPVTRRFGNARTVLLVSISHVLGTVVSQGIAFVRLELGLLSDSIRTIPDVGPSYVLCAALVAAFLYGPGRWRRLVPLAGWCALVPVLFDGLLSLDVAAVGHLVAMVTGALVGGLLLLLERRRAGAGGRASAQVAHAIEVAGAAEAKVARAVTGVVDAATPHGTGRAVPSES
ncbi:rhomboid family intramembrane serine protease [Actinomadura fibrosa]|uniref:Rhomboid family intramembrane serine protease n=1 Tax=Actinomadura fibrosa TaxID=111802 RepID=A0ABW2XEN1_9ACTN|nr:rhomboid family intramembrane serine protease [Actinomadura fibrosa]